MILDVDVKSMHLGSIGEADKDELISFVKGICIVEESYLHHRFALYDEVVYVRRDNKLCAFQLIQTFTYEDDLYIYFGPLFSRQGCFLELFFSYLQEKMTLHQDCNIHLLAEIQNPEVLLLFKGLFEDYAYPHFHHSPIAEGVKNSVLVFANALTHIQGLDIERFTTTSKESLYRPRTTLAPLEEWLALRNIDLSRGDCVVLYSIVPVEREARKNLIAQLQQGEKRLNHWKVGREEVVTLFRRGIVSDV
ncbi:hypothetical protein ACLM5H_18510 [Fredinandcohnia humi]